MSFEWQPETPIGFAAFFAILWCSVSFFLATLGGWRLLAEAYRLQDRFDGSRWRFASARMRWGVNYNGCLTFGANEHGLYLAALFLFRLGHPPLFIPWSDLRARETQGVMFKYIEFTFPGADGVTLRVPHPLGSALLKAGGREPGSPGMGSLP